MGLKYKTYDLGEPVTHTDYVLRGFILGDFDLRGAVRRCFDDAEAADLVRRLIACEAITKEEAKGVVV